MVAAAVVLGRSQRGSAGQRFVIRTARRRPPIPVSSKISDTCWPIELSCSATPSWRRNRRPSTRTIRPTRSTDVILPSVTLLPTSRSPRCAAAFCASADGLPVTPTVASAASSVKQRAKRFMVSSIKLRFGVEYIFGRRAFDDGGFDNTAHRVQLAAQFLF